VDALDPSPAWHAHLARRAARAGWRNVRLLRARVEDAALEPGAYDLVFARWVLSFLPDPGRVVRRLAAALRPGGVLAVQDYDHEGVSLFPESAGFRAVVRATRALYAKGGGDAFVAGSLPRHLRAAGLTVDPAVATVLCGGPSSGAFRWADAFFPPHSATMVRAGVLARAERARFLREWAERRADPDALFFSPIVVDLAGRRARGARLSVRRGGSRRTSRAARSPRSARPRRSAPRAAPPSGASPPR
jgi:SAM-dependent methyltransferase